jgi:hypothetical protein
MLDGRLDESAWAQAPVAADFFQKLPSNGAPASERTEARFVYDNDNLYVGVTCYDTEPDKRLIKDLREDFDFGTTDLVQIFIDSIHDRRSGFTFVVNPAGARRDSQVSTSGGANQDWDGVWDAKVSMGDGAWFIEFAIPFKTLRFSGATQQEWGVNLSRKIMHKFLGKVFGGGRMRKKVVLKRLKRHENGHLRLGWWLPLRGTAPPAPTSVPSWVRRSHRCSWRAVR